MGTGRTGWLSCSKRFCRKKIINSILKANNRRLNRNNVFGSRIGSQILFILERGFSVKKILFCLLVMTVMLSGCIRETGGQAEHSTSNDDSRVLIALLDTGVSGSAIDSEHLLEGYNYVMDSEDTEDLINHGTAVASIILGCDSANISAMAQEAYIVPLVVVTKQDGETVSASVDKLAMAIRDSVDVYGADIINVSLGIQKDVAELEEAVEYAEEKGVLVVSAVGNGGSQGTLYYPAAYDTVLSVGSCDKHGERSDFSQDGADVLAMGEDIWLASRNGMTYGAKGTSYSTGFVTAEAANILLNEPEILPQELRERIIMKAADSGGFLPDSNKCLD